ncbi:MAG: methyltransferase domain-containing protein [Candidatus Korobacteraceae bacterium]|jgi:SAM-dependent methyltransferase
MLPSVDNSILKGVRLYGDDFTEEHIKEWFADEKHSYHELVNSVASEPYLYRELNVFHAFRHLPERQWEHVLGFGSYTGEDLLPIVDRVKMVTIVDPAPVSTVLPGMVSYIVPNPSGRLSLLDESIDLVICFNVLHHIPNVSFVVSELTRCLAPGGWMLVSEPRTSMGDWTHQRPGMTAHERGIPELILRNILVSAGLTLRSHSRQKHWITKRFIQPYYDCPGRSIYNSPALVRLDAWLSKWVHWNRQYHPLKRHRGPSASGVVFVVEKRGT